MSQEWTQVGNDDMNKLKSPPGNDEVENVDADDIWGKERGQGGQSEFW